MTTTTTPHLLKDSYAETEVFWKTYLRGRPQLPPSLFARIATYHAAHSGSFNVAHDVGAGVGVHSPRLRELFEHVIVSDVVESNVEIAAARLGKVGDAEGKEERGGYIFRAGPIEDAQGIEPGSVDLVFAATMLHFADLNAAFAAVGEQLKPGGTLAILVCGLPLLFRDEEVQAVWLGLWHRGCRNVFARFEGTEERRRNLLRLGRVADGYDSIAVDQRFFRPGALRVRLNHEEWAATMPEEITEEYRAMGGVSAIRPDEKIVVENEPGWSFKIGMQGLRETFATFPSAKVDPETYEPYWKQLEELIGEGEVDGVWPARLILATRK